MTFALQTYLAEIHRLWSTGVATGELSYYTPLQNLFNELGRTLKPKVFCLSNPKDTGAGHPDFYLFTANQLPKAKSLKEPIPDAPPERGVVEAKRATADVRKRIETKQVNDYLRQGLDWPRRPAESASQRYAENRLDTCEPVEPRLSFPPLPSLISRHFNTQCLSPGCPAVVAR